MILLNAIKIEIKVDEYNIDSLYTLICHHVLIKEENLSNIFFWEKAKLGSLESNSLEKLPVLVMK
jgi:hypothetical protein